MLLLAALLTHDALLVTDLLPDVVIYAGGALFLAAVDGVVFPSCSRGWTADGAVPAVATAEVAAGTAAAAMRATVATSPRVAGAAAQGSSTADVLADCGHDHRRGARLSACPADLVHGLHLLFCSDRNFSTRASPFSRSFNSKSPLIAYMHVSFGKRGVKLFSTMRLISRAGVIILCFSSFMSTMFTRAKYSDTDSFAPISRVSNSLFALSYASSSVSSAIFDSARHASKGEPIASTIFIISGSFSSAFVRDCQTCKDLCTNVRLYNLSSSARGVPDVFIDTSESSAESHLARLAHV